MTLTPSTATHLRLLILQNIDSGEEAIIDERFVQPIFGTYQYMLDWCKAWNITCESYSLKGVNRSNSKEPIIWIEFKHNDPDTLLLIEPTNPRDL